jgi:hypothetical protein
MQFDKVEGPIPAAPPACAQCRRPLDEYFALGGHMFCRPCVDGFRSSGSVWRALLLGAAAAVAGSIVWALFTELSGREWGIIGVVVGLFVGTAVRRGARNQGGWKYQALAMALTYVSITGSYIPSVIEDGDGFAFALVRPFVGGVGFMGWIIIGIALYEAWKLNRRLPITGPLRFGGGLSVPAPEPVTPPGMPPPAAAT